MAVFNSPRISPTLNGLPAAGKQNQSPWASKLGQPFLKTVSRMLKPQADLPSTARLSHTAQHVGPALNCRSLLVHLPTGWDSPYFSERCSWTACSDTQSGLDPTGSAGAREASGVSSGETWLCFSSTGSLDITRRIAKQ